MTPKYVALVNALVAFVRQHPEIQSSVAALCPEDEQLKAEHYLASTLVDFERRYGKAVFDETVKMAEPFIKPPMEILIYYSAASEGSNLPWVADLGRLQEFNERLVIGRVLQVAVVARLRGAVPESPLVELMKDRYVDYAIDWSPTRDTGCLELTVMLKEKGEATHETPPLSQRVRATAKFVLPKEPTSLEGLIDQLNAVTGAFELELVKSIQQHMTRKLMESSLASSLCAWVASLPADEREYLESTPGIAAKLLEQLHLS